jgi:putative transposase
MEGIKRRHLGELAWRELLQRFDACGLSAMEFCKREGVTKSSFQRWRLRLASMSSGDAGGQRNEPREASPADFVDLGALATAGVGAGRLDLKLDLGGGLSLHLVRG